MRKAECLQDGVFGRGAAFRSFSDTFWEFVGEECAPSFSGLKIEMLSLICKDWLMS